MRIKYSARLGLVACLAAAFVLVAATSAFAAPFFGGGVSALGGIRTLSSGTFDLPAGSRVGGTLAAEDEQDWLVLVRKGQPINLTLRTKAGYSGPAWIAAFDTLATSDTVPPLSDIGMVTGVGSTNVTFTVAYDTVMAVSVYAPTPGHGAYTLDYQLDDMVTTSTITRISGVNRFDTGVKISQSVFGSDSASAAIVATGRNFADALAASGLAGSYDCPILLTEPSKLSAGVDEEITRIGATTVFVIGSSSAVSDAAFDALDHDGRDVVRLEGDNRYETAAAISEEIWFHETEEGRTPSDKAFIVNGKNYPDALAVSPFAFSQKMPILLVTPDAVPPATAGELAAMEATGAYVIGGPSSVSTDTMDALGVDSTRVAGDNRLTTAIAASQYAVSQGWASWNHVGLTTGWNYPDALAGGVALGKQGGVLLLTRPTLLPKDDYLALYGARASVTDATIFGSPAAVFGSIKGSTDAALQGKAWVDPYGFMYTPVY